MQEREIPADKIPVSRQVALVNDYFRDFLETYREPAMREAHQDESLTLALFSHGVRTDAGTARQMLERVSAENRRRIETGAPELSAEVQREAGELVSGLVLFPVHNTHHLDSLGTDIPILSSRDIGRLGLPGGLNSQEPFNHRFLRSDDQVFFHAHFSRKAEDAVVPDTAYGENGLVLKPDYAGRQAWVSPFVMYPEHLQTFARVCCPEQARKLPQSAWDLLARGAEQRLPELQRDALQEVTDSLGRYDFTAQDYQAMVRNLLLRGLSEQRSRDEGAYQTSLKRLRSDNPLDIHKVVSELVFSRHNLPPSFEVKVPVAVPREAIIPVRR